MKVTLHPSVTADGFIADEYGECYSWINDQDEARYEDALVRAGAELVGCKTYEQYRSDFDDRTNVTTFVYTSRAGQINFQDSKLVKFIYGTPQEAVAIIEKAGFQEVIVSGGGEMNGLLASEGLLDELHLSVHPIVLGKGVHLFGSYEIDLKLELLSVNTDVPGVVQANYRIIKQ